MTEVCSSPLTLSQQLTHIELERLSFIGPEEFVQAFAKENPNVETSFKDMKKTRNLESYIQWFNRLSYFVATQVCSVRYAGSRSSYTCKWRGLSSSNNLFSDRVSYLVFYFELAECQEEATHKSH